MNEQLKFSWGHVIAYLALIFISFVSFDGVVYFTNGDFPNAGIAMVAIDVLLFLFFIGAQFLKATERKFSVKIWLERFLVFLSPFVFVVLMIPFFHFWTVYDRGTEIENGFSRAISEAKNIFPEYEQYCALRMDEYSAHLSTHAFERKISAEFYANTFSNEEVDAVRNSMRKTLRTQLLSSNYYNLRDAACGWIDDNNTGVSTFNVFIFGNIREITSAINRWNGQLDNFSKKILSYESYYGFSPRTFSEYQTSRNLNDALASLDRLTKSFTVWNWPGLFPIALAAGLYFALLAPYFLQDRHTKSRERLFSRARVSVPDSVALSHISSKGDDSDDMSPFTL